MSKQIIVVLNDDVRAMRPDGVSDSQWYEAPAYCPISCALQMQTDHTNISTLPGMVIIDGVYYACEAAWSHIVVPWMSGEGDLVVVCESLS